jgi:hypothetical protein
MLFFLNFHNFHKKNFYRWVFYNKKKLIIKKGLCACAYITKKSYSFNSNLENLK